MIPELKAVNALGVHLEGRRIGAITRSAGERYVFAFEQDYYDDPNRPRLSLSFKGQSGGLVMAIRPTGVRLPAFFSNLLPEGDLRAYLAEKAGVKEEREFYLMALLGGDLTGAATVMPMTGAGEDVWAGREAPIPEPAGKRQRLLRFSLAGVQLKFSAVLEKAGGLTIPAGGAGGSWIVKLPSPRFAAVSENEYAMLELARAVGIEVPRTRLVRPEEIDGLPGDVERVEGLALAVERFDRAEDGGRIHMEDFAQVFGQFPSEKYESRSYANIASVLWAETGDAGAYEFVRRLAFSVAIGNGDMHLKNWSVLYPDGRVPILSPAYDFVSTVPYIPGDELALRFGQSKSLEGITLDQIRLFADKGGLPVKPVWEIVRETMERTREAWKTLAEKDVLPAKMLGAIERQIERATGVTGAE